MVPILVIENVYYAQQTTLATNFTTSSNAHIFKQKEKRLIKKHFIVRPNTIKFGQLLNITNKTMLTNLGKFINVILKYFKWNHMFNKHWTLREEIGQIVFKNVCFWRQND